MLPGISGIELLRRIRAQDDHTPVILLTAKSSVEDKVSGLDLGANDYITKPFQIEELLARIRVALRMKSAQKAGRRSFTHSSISRSSSKRTNETSNKGRRSILN